MADDYTTWALLVSSAFFVALSFGLLIRYRQVSQRINVSSDLGRDLWQALEQRMKKQDERILDMMGRLEVLQMRTTALPEVQTQTNQAAGPSPGPPSPAPTEIQSNGSQGPTPVAQQPESQMKSQASQVSHESRPLPTMQPEVLLDETQVAAIRFLRESPKNTRQITDLLVKSREHTARIMKGLFELGLVRRDDSTKPFVYQLSDQGRRYLDGKLTQ